MKTLRAVICAVGMSSMMLAGAGCGSDPIKELEGFADKMCACKDKECADKVNKEMMEWGKKQKKSDAKADEEMAKKAEPVLKKLMECSTKAMTGGGDDKKE